MRPPSKREIVGSNPTGDTTFLAQMVERSAFNRNVAGSIPAGGNFFNTQMD